MNGKRYPQYTFAVQKLTGGYSVTVWKFVAYDESPAVWCASEFVRNGKRVEALAAARRLRQKVKQREQNKSVDNPETGR